MFNSAKGVVFSVLTGMEPDIVGKGIFPHFPIE